MADKTERPAAPAGCEWLFVEKFGGEVLIETEHPLAVEARSKHGKTGQAKAEKKAPAKKPSKKGGKK